MTRSREAALGGAVLAFVATLALLGPNLPIPPMWQRLVVLVGFFVVAACAGMLASLRPRVVVGTLIAIGATVLPGGLTSIAAAGIRTDLIELLAIAVAGSAAIGTLGMGRRFNVAIGAGLGLPLSAFALAATVGAAVGVSRGATWADVQGPLRVYLLYPIAIAFASIFRRASDRRRLASLTVGLACGAAVVVVLQQLGVRLIDYAVSDEVVTLGAASEVARIRTPATSLFVLAVVIVAAQAATGFRRVHAAQLGLLASGLLFSYTRSTWLAAAVGLAILIALRPGVRIPLRGVRAAVITVSIAAIVLAAGTAGLAGESGRTMAARVLTSLSPSVFSDVSYQQRLDENEVAMAAIREHPVTGVGLARPFGVWRQTYVPNPPRMVAVPQLYLHNLVLTLWLQLGLAGVLAFAWLLVRVCKSITLARREGDMLRVAGAASAIALVVQGQFQTAALHRPSILAFALALGFASPVAVSRRRARNVETSAREIHAVPR